MKFAKVSALAAAVVLTACGGGGGGDDAPAPIDARQAHASYVALDGTWEVAGRGSDNNVYRFVFEFQPLANGRFPYNGVSGVRRQVTARGYVNDALVSTSTTIDYFGTANLVTMGAESEGDCLVTTGGAVPPASAEVGDQGGLFNYTVRQGCVRDGTVIGSGRYLWTLERIDGRSFYCVKTAGTDAGITASTRECYEVNTDGSFGTRAAVLVEMSGTGIPPFELQATNY